jgi:vancomycin permeability regulator SanA
MLIARKGICVPVPSGERGAPLGLGAEAQARRTAPLVVLGCRPIWAGDGRLQGALGRRVGAARERLGGDAGWFVLTGGRTWQGVVEADAMADDLVRGGVAPEHIVRERCSMTTLENARFSADLLRRAGVGRITLVTCDWHMARAAGLFRREGLEVEPCPAEGPAVSSWVRWYRSGHEWVSARLPVSRGARG